MLVQGTARLRVKVKNLVGLVLEACGEGASGMVALVPVAVAVGGDDRRSQAHHRTRHAVTDHHAQSR